MANSALSIAIMIPTWALTSLAFAAGTLFGVLALGDLGRSVAEPSTAASSALDESADPSVALARPATEVATGSPAAVEEVEDAKEAAPEDPRIAAALASWRSAEARIADLQTRLAALERTFEERLQAESQGRPKAPQTSDERRDMLVAAGVGLDLAEDIVWRDNQLELDRLNLRDQAIREGWMGSDKYRDAVNALAQQGGSLREEIGDAAWDRYLYLSGEKNRVSVTSVIPGSAADAAGLQSGDVIESYAETQPFGYGELRQATTEGEKGELVAVRIRRGGRLLDVWVPRGPLGARLEKSRAEPLP